MPFESFTSTPPVTKRRSPCLTHAEVARSVRFSTYKFAGESTWRHRIGIGAQLASVCGFDITQPVEALFDPKNKVVRLVCGAGDRKLYVNAGGTQLQVKVPTRRGVPKKKGTVTATLLRAAPGILEFALPKAA